MDSARQKLLDAFRSDIPGATGLDQIGQSAGPVLTASLRSQVLVVPNDRLCSYGALLSLYEGAKRLMAEQVELLPPDHAWRKKGVHGAETAAEALTTFPQVLSEMSDDCAWLLLIIASIHDLGRPLQFLRTGQPGYTGQDHGHFTVELLDQHGLLSGFTPTVANLIRYVIVFHSAKDTPGPPTFGDEYDQHRQLWLAMIRDLDKVSLFRHKTHLYLWDRAEIARQENILRKLNPNYVGEVGQILAPRYLDEFTRCQPLDRKDLLSYEAYMLNFLAWIFDLNTDVALRAVWDCGAITQLLAYFKWNMLIEDERIPVIISAVVKEYLTQRGIQCTFELSPG